MIHTQVLLFFHITLQEEELNNQLKASLEEMSTREQACLVWSNWNSWLGDFTIVIALSVRRRLNQIKFCSSLFLMYRTSGRLWRTWKGNWNSPECMCYACHAFYTITTVYLWVTLIRTPDVCTEKCQHYAFTATDWGWITDFYIIDIIVDALCKKIYATKMTIS